MKFVVQDQSFQSRLDAIIELRDKKQIDDVKELALTLYDDAKEQNNVEVQNIASYYLAEMSFYVNEFDQCSTLCWGLLQYYENHDKDNLYIVTCNLLGALYQEKLDMHNAILYFFKGYQQATLVGEKAMECRILNNIGSLFFAVECYDEALQYFMKVLHILEENMISEEVYEIVLVNILATYVRQKRVKDAIAWESKYQKILKNVNHVIAQLGYLSYRVAKDAYQNDVEMMREHLDEMLEESEKKWVGSVTSALVLDCIESCIQIACYEEAKKAFSIVEKHVIEDDYKIQLRIADLYIQMYQKTEKNELLVPYLKAYYTYHQKLSLKDNEIEYMILKNIVQLEEERYVKKKLMYRQAQLSAQNEYDAFTGLLHKTSYVDYVNMYFLNKNPSQFAAFLMVDVDDFKYVNDTYGHMYGDEILHALSKLLKSHLHSSDIAGRIGGDEFSFVLISVDTLENLYERLQRILEDVKHIHIKDEERTLSISIGGVYTNQSLTYEKLVKVADEALYQAKAKGKNMFVVIEQR